RIFWTIYVPCIGSSLHRNARHGPCVTKEQVIEVEARLNPPPARPSPPALFVAVSGSGFIRIRRFNVERGHEQLGGKHDSHARPDPWCIHRSAISEPLSRHLSGRKGKCSPLQS